MMLDSWWPDTLLFWHWWIFAAFCLSLELVVAGVLFLWIGLAAGVVGVVAMLIPGMEWEVQVLLFAALAVLSTVIGRRIWRPGSVVSDHPHLNRRAHRHVGRVVTLTTDLEDGQARVRVGDSEWSAEVEGSPLAHLPRGSHVRVTGVRGSVLMVTPLDAPSEAASGPESKNAAPHPGR